MKPTHAFVVGAAKSGTTALHYLLGQHPEICTASVEETRYFCRDLHESSDRYHGGRRYYPYRTDEQYLGLFPGRDAARVVLDVSPDYLSSRVAAAEIRRFAPDAKIIVSLRNPVSFLRSLHNQAVSSMAEPLTDLRQALAAEADRKRGQRLSGHVVAPEYLFYSERARFDVQLERYLEHFDREQIEVILFEDFKNDQRRIYRKLLEFLEVDTEFEPEWQVYNASKQLRMKWLRWIIYAPRLRRAYGYLPPSVYAFLSARFRSLTSKPAAPEPIPDDLREELEEQYRPVVDRLETLLEEHGFVDGSSSLTRAWGFRP